MAAVRNIVALTEEEAIRTAKTILNNILRSTTDVVNHVVQPNGNLAAVESFAPSKAGTPKRKKMTSLLGGTPLKLNHANIVIDSSLLAPSPMRLTPKRRKMAGPKKGVQFTPKKKSPSKAKRAVRWRDDDEDGTLADFSKTPQKDFSTPEDLTEGDLPSIPLPQSSLAESSLLTTADDSLSPIVLWKEVYFRGANIQLLIPISFHHRPTHYCRPVITIVKVRIVTMR